MMYGYARVSTKEQNEARQIAALTEAGVDQKNIYLDKQSGKDFRRKNYQKTIRKLKENDVVVFQSIDCMGRNYEEIIEQWKIITKDKKARIVVLDMPLLNTSEDKDLTGTLIADIVLQLLSYVAETERNFIRKRQRKGIKQVKKKGVRFGRPRKPLPDNFRELIKMIEDKKITAEELSQICNVSRSTLYRSIREGIYRTACL